MFDSLLSIEELEAGTRRLARDRRVTVTPVGVSRLGRPIEMISLGDGTSDALIVGVPHPNEPAGAVTVERMIALLLRKPSERRGYRWHFIKAIDPEGLNLNRGWLKKRTLTDYLENFFRPALHRQPETTFPLDIPGIRFEESTPENCAWQQAFALTRPRLHASLHHCDYGGVFYSLSRPLPAAIAGLESLAQSSKLGINDHDDVMDAEQWTPSVKRYPSVPELMAKAKARGAAWAYPWTVGDMSPGYGESRYGSFTLIAEVPLWDSEPLHDSSPSDITHGQQQVMLGTLTAKARELARSLLPSLAPVALAPDAKECLWSLERGLQMMPSAEAPGTGQCAQSDRKLSRHDFELMHTEQALFALRTYGLILRLASLILIDQPAHPGALQAHREAQDSLKAEMAVIEARTRFVPVPLEVVTDFQLQSIFICAEALTADAKQSGRLTMSPGEI